MWDAITYQCLIQVRRGWVITPYGFVWMQLLFHVTNQILVQLISVSKLSPRYQTISTDVIKTWWRHQMETFSALLALCAGNSPVPVNSPHKGQWRGVLMFSLICVWIDGWVNNREADDLRRRRTHYNVTVMTLSCIYFSSHASSLLTKHDVIIRSNSTKWFIFWRIILLGYVKLNSAGIMHPCL